MATRKPPPAGAIVIGAFVLLGAFVFARRTPTVVPGQPWLAGDPATAYALDADGMVTTHAGVTLALRSTDTTARWGHALVSVPADTLRGHRVRIATTLALTPDPGSAPPAVTAHLGVLLERDGRGWLALDAHDGPVGAGAAPARREMVFVVPDSVTALTVDVTLGGRGRVEARGLTLTSLGPVDTLAPLTAAARADLDSALAAARAGALARRTLPWPRIEAEVRRLAAGARSAAEVALAIRVLMKALGDRHSYYLSPVARQRYATGADVQPMPTVDARTPGVGVVQLPAHMGADSTATRAYALALLEGLRAVAPRATCGWIVDLREDRGGNMGPMIGGLAPLLGDDTVGVFLAPGDAPDTWVRLDTPYTAGVLLADVGLMVPRELAALADAPVAVLTGPHTASSGEAVAIAFRGRPRTRSFGAPTAGVSTGIYAVPLPSGASLGLARSVMGDRSGRAYGGAVVPDEPVSESATGDAVRERAAAWLRSQSSCHRTS